MAVSGMGYWFSEGLSTSRTPGARDNSSLFIGSWICVITVIKQRYSALGQISNIHSLPSPVCSNGTRGLNGDRLGVCPKNGHAHCCAGNAHLLAVQLEDLQRLPHYFHLFFRVAVLLLKPRIRYNLKRSHTQKKE